MTESSKTRSGFDFILKSNRENHDVLQDGVIVGRVFLSPAAPEHRRWMWASGHNGGLRRAAHGYEPTREAAIAKAEAGYRFYALYDNESQRQTQAAGHLDLARSGMHDSNDAGARTDLWCNGGLANWRLRSSRRLTDQTPSEECSGAPGVDGQEFRRASTHGPAATVPCAVPRVPTLPMRR